MKFSYIILLTGFLASIIVRLFLIIPSLEIADVHSLKEMGQLYLNGINPYLALNYNPYPPLAIYLEAATILLAQLTGISFPILEKIWPNLADLITGGLIFWYLIKHGTQPKQATFWSLAFLLNPISILISASHGQIDSIPTLLTILAILILVIKPSSIRVYLSGLLIGLAVAIKPGPLMLIPLMIFYHKLDLKQMIGFLIMTTLPTFLLLLPFLQDNSYFVLTKLVSYSGSTDFGLPALFKELNYLQTGQTRLYFSQTILLIDKLVFLTCLGGFIFIFTKSQKLILAVLGVYLLFMTVYFGISAQYLSWILALAALLKQRLIFVYSLFGTISLLGFYLFINPLIIAGNLTMIPPYQSQYILIYALGNCLLVATTLWWAFKIITNLRFSHRIK